MISVNYLLICYNNRLRGNFNFSHVPPARLSSQLFGGQTSYDSGGKLLWPPKPADGEKDWVNFKSAVTETVFRI